MNQSRIGGHQAEPQPPNSATSTPSQASAPSPYLRSSPGAASSSDNGLNSRRSAFPPYRDNTVLHTVSVPCSPAFPVKDDQIGPKHFSRLKLLGRGGIGQVFLVRLKNTDKLYAMKVLSRDEMIQKNKVKRAHAVPPRVVQHQLSFSDKIRKSLLKRSSTSLNNFEIVSSEPVLPYQTNSFVGTEEYIAPEVVNGVSQSSAVDWWTLGILIYEMLTGTTPFKGSYTDETFKNIVNENVKFPDDITISNDCKQLVKKLLRRDADKRLGAQEGATEIKKSRWFREFNFALIRNETPPIIPKIRDPLDLSQYRRMPEDDPPSSAAPSQSPGHMDDDADNPFRHFNLTKSDSLQRQY
ncbi:unnamed protein product [Agarophyton chilense]